MAAEIFSIMYQPMIIMMFSILLSQPPAILGLCLLSLTGTKNLCNMNSILDYFCHMKSIYEKNL